MGNERLPLIQCQRNLAKLWLWMSGAIFALMMVQSVAGAYPDQVADAWSWLTPNIVPTLLLMIGVLVRQTRRSGAVGGTADRFIYRLAFGLSAFYLAALSLSILGQPFAPMAPLDLLRMSNAWLVPLQGIAAAAIGAFFTEQAPASD